MLYLDLFNSILLYLMPAIGLVTFYFHPISDLPLYLYTKVKPFGCAICSTFWVGFLVGIISMGFTYAPLFGVLGWVFYNQFQNLFNKF
jgi:hypothetical protein